MFRFEKVFQNDDKFYVYLEIFSKTFLIYIFIYVFSILEKNTIYDINKLNIYLNSNYYIFSLYLPIFFFFNKVLILKNRIYFNQYYKKNFRDIILLLINFILVLFILWFDNYSLQISRELFFLNILLIFVFFILNIFFSKFYVFLINSNVIQRNILLVGKYKDIYKIFKEKKNSINIYKCCIITDLDKNHFKKIRSEIKIPLFDLEEDVRSILEYHHLGQIWILDNSYNKENIENMIGHIIKFSVDIIIVKIDKVLSSNNKKLINDKYEYVNYEISRFYGFNFFIKIILDKILSLLFIIILSPILIICSIFIYLEDGFPILFLQDRTGWDGRRFRIIKLRTLKNIKFDKTKQVIQNDKRLLKIGKFMRKFSIDEVPQFFNVLLGDMSIVGPRPHMVEHDIYYSNIFKEFLKRHKTSPGITGWAQVNGLRGATPDPKLMRKRMDFDLWYLNNWSIYLDILIIIKTFYALLRYKGD